MSISILDRRASALIIIDMQEDFASPSGAAYVNGTAEIVSSTASTAELFRKYKKDIIHVIRLYYPDGSNAELCRRKRIASGNNIVSPQSKGAAILPVLLSGSAKPIDHEQLLKGEIIQIDEYDYVIYKPRWGAFFQTKLHENLLAKGITRLFIAGCNFPNCPRTTVYKASERDYELGIIPSTISGIYEKGVAELENIGVHILKDELQVQAFLEQE